MGCCPKDSRHPVHPGEEVFKVIDNFSALLGLDNDVA